MLYTCPFYKKREDKTNNGGNRGGYDPQLGRPPEGLKIPAAKGFFPYVEGITSFLYECKPEGLKEGISYKSYGKRKKENCRVACDGIPCKDGYGEKNGKNNPGQNKQIL